MPTCTGHCCKSTIYDSTCQKTPCQKTPHPRRGALSAACCIQIEKHKENSAVFPGCCILNGAIYVLCFCSESHNILHCSASFCIALRYSGALWGVPGAFVLSGCRAFRMALERSRAFWSVPERSAKRFERAPRRCGPYQSLRHQRITHSSCRVPDCAMRGKMR